MFYQDRYKNPESESNLPDNIHLYQNNHLYQMVLAKLGHQATVQPQLNRYFQLSYEYLLENALNLFLDLKEVKSETRMKNIQKEGQFRFESLDLESKFSIIALARAGTWPSHICFDFLNHLFSPENIRQDHVYINRKTNDEGKVVGVDFSGSKIGGDFKDRYIFLPDPMGATGSTIAHVYNLIQGLEQKPKKIIALHLIITPEYVRKMKAEFPEVEVVALRYDRGLSSEKILSSKYGEFFEEEKGLNDIQYILPGAGGIGEVLNNSFV